MTTKNIAIGIIITLVFISVVIFFCVLLVRLYARKIKNYTQQLFQKDLDFQKTLTHTVIETQEQVLNNISQDLHDDAGQQLTYINFQIENLKLDSPELCEKLNPLSKSVGNLAGSIRNISHALNNQLLLQQDVIKAIETEVARLQHNKHLSLAFYFEEVHPKKFDSNEQIIIYRIFQECLNNCFKHAKAKKISVVIATTPRFEMVISDDGVGFDVTDAKHKRTLGLQNMQKRADSIGYSLIIVGNIGEGTTLKLSENVKQ